LTEGNDNTSMVSLEDLVRKSQQDHVRIYAVGLGRLSRDNKDWNNTDGALDRLVEAPVEKCFIQSHCHKIEKSADQIAHDIRNQSTTNYIPSAQQLDGVSQEAIIDTSVVSNSKPVHSISAQNLPSWNRTEQTDAFSGFTYTQFAVTGVFLNAPRYTMAPVTCPVDWSS
jgi:hypothetical protein